MDETIEQNKQDDKIKVTIECTGLNLTLNSKLVFDNCAKIGTAKKRRICRYPGCEKNIDAKEEYIQVGHTQNAPCYHKECALKKLTDLRENIHEENFLEAQIYAIAQIRSIEQILNKIIPETISEDNLDSAAYL